MSPGRECCRQDDLGQKRSSDSHHAYYPKCAYQTELEKTFRELEENKMQLCLCEHYWIHETKQTPAKPTVQEMVVALTVGFENE